MAQTLDVGLLIDGTVLEDASYANISLGMDDVEIREALIASERFDSQSALAFTNRFSLIDSFRSPVFNEDFGVNAYVFGDNQKPGQIYIVTDGTESWSPQYNNSELGENTNILTGTSFFQGNQPFVNNYISSLINDPNSPIAGKFSDSDNPVVFFTHSQSYSLLLDSVPLEYVESGFVKIIGFNGVGHTDVTDFIPGPFNTAAALLPPLLTAMQQTMIGADPSFELNFLASAHNAENSENVVNFRLHRDFVSLYGSQPGSTITLRTPDDVGSADYFFTDRTPHSLLVMREVLEQLRQDGETLLGAGTRTVIEPESGAIAWVRNVNGVDYLVTESGNLSTQVDTIASDLGIPFYNVRSLTSISGLIANSEDPSFTLGSTDFLDRLLPDPVDTTTDFTFLVPAAFASGPAIDAIFAINDTTWLPTGDGLSSQRIVNGVDVNGKPTAVVSLREDLTGKLISQSTWWRDSDSIVRKIEIGREVVGDTSSPFIYGYVEQYVSGRFEVIRRFDADLNQSTNEVEPDLEKGPVDYTVREVGKPNVVSGKQVGETFGSVLAAQISPDNVFAEIAIQSGLSAVFGNFGEAIELFTSLDDISLELSVEAAFKDFFDDPNVPGGFDGDLFIQLKGAGAGAIASFITAELFDAVGIDGVAGEVLQTVSNSALNTVISNLDRIGELIPNGGGEVYDFGDVLSEIKTIDLLDAAGAYFGTRLALEAGDFDTTAGQIGATIGSSVGKLFGSAIPIPFIGQFVGSFIGTYVGGFIGDLFGTEARAWGEVVYDPISQRFEVGEIITEGDGSADLVQALAQSAVETMNAILDAIGGTIVNEPFGVVSFGHDADELFYEVDGNRHNVAIDATDLVLNFGVHERLSQMQISGGDAVKKRAFYKTLDRSFDKGDAEASVPEILARAFEEGAFDRSFVETLLGNLLIGQEYNDYLGNLGAINALIAAEPESAFSAGWLVALLQAESLDLQHRQEADWIGGWQAVIESSNAIEANVSAIFSNNSRYFLSTDALETGLFLEDQISSDTKKLVFGGASSDRIIVEGDLILSGISASNDVADPILIGRTPMEANQKIYSSAIFNAGGGHDYVVGGDLGNDIKGGSGNDYLFGGKLADWLIGGDGNDRLFTGRGEGDAAFGGAGDDVLRGDTGGEWFEGGSGNDVLISESGADYLTGGAGNDLLAGGTESDTYIYRNGDGRDRLSDSGQAADEDVVSFGEGIAPTDVSVWSSSSSDSLTLTLFGSGADQSIELVGQGLGQSSGVEQVQFSDGTIWSKSTLLSSAQLPTAAGALTGTTGDDTINGTLADETINGGAGNDTTSGDGGSDTYEFDLGDGQDTISDRGSWSDVDRLVFGAGILASDIVISRDMVEPDAVTLSVSGTSDSIKLSGQSSGQGDGIEEVLFADGTTWNAADIESLYLSQGATSGDDVILGFDGNESINSGNGDDQLSGGRGNDFLEGAVGSDVYRFNLGDGKDTIFDNGVGGDVDELHFGEGIRPTDIFVGKNPHDSHDLVLSIGGTGDAITFSQQDHPFVYGIENVRFVDGTVWSRTDLQQLYNDQHSTIGNDRIIGINLDESFSGGAGDDYLAGGRGSDSYFFNLGGGRDTIHDYGETPDVDKLFFGAGIAPADISTSFDPADLGNILLSINGTADAVLLQNQDTTFDFEGIDEFHFDDGTVWTYDQLKLEFLNQASTANDNYVYGFESDDVITGGVGDDYLAGEDGSDTYNFGIGDGDDIIFDYGGVSDIDKVVFGAGISTADIEFRNDPNNVGNIVVSINGTGDSLTLKGQDGALQSLQGIEEFHFADGTIWSSTNIREEYLAHVSTSGDDRIFGFAQDDTISGGFGDDYLEGEEGSDTYNYNLGDGSDTIHENGTSLDVDRLVFGAGIDPADVSVFTDELKPSSFKLEPYDLILAIDGTNDRILLDEQTRNSLWGIEEIEFADGTIWSRATFEAAAVSEADTANPIVGTSADETVTGTNGGDVMHGEDGADTLTGGAGTDYVYGGSGDDVYHYAPGDGIDTIFDLSGDDRIVFGTGITTGDVFVERLNYDVVQLSFTNGGDSIRITGQDGNLIDSIESFVFADGTVWTELDIENTYAQRVSTNGDDWLINGATLVSIDLGTGDDYAIGVTGDKGDTYVYDAGDGNDTIEEGFNADTSPDKISFGSGITPGEVVVRRTEYNDLILSFAGAGDSIRLVGHDGDERWGIESFEFSDGTIWNKEDIEERHLSQIATDGDDYYVGNSIADTIDLGKGNDVALDELGGGGDTYVYEVGDGHDFIDEGFHSEADTLRFGEGINKGDLRFERTDDNQLIISFGSLDGSIRLNRQSGGERWGIENFEFADGTVWTKADIETECTKQAGTAGDDLYIGNELNDTIDLGKGNDYAVDNIYGGGGDTYLFSKGDGNDIIDEGYHSAVDTLIFGESIRLDDLVITRQGTDNEDVLIEINGYNDSILLLRQLQVFAGSSYRGIESFEFADGTILNEVQLAALANEVTASGEFLRGTADDDLLATGSGADTLTGEIGNDVLRGGTGSDIYRFDLGDGHDTIYDPTSAGDTDRLEFGAGISASDILISVPTTDSDDLVLSIQGTDDVIYLDEQNVSATSGIDEVTFVDGTVWTRADLVANALSDFATAGNDTLFGTVTADTISGGTGDDILDAGVGADTYTFNLGDGQDTINDTGTGADTDRLAFGAGIAPSSIVVTRGATNSADIVLSISGTTDSVTLAGQDGGDNIEEIAFDDGTVWTAADLRQTYLAQQSTAGDDTIAGFVGDDTIDAGTGNDTSKGGTGSDSYQFNLGDGQDVIAEHGFESDVDRLVFGAGILTSDIVVTRSGTDLRDWTLSISGTSDSVTLQRQADGAVLGVEEIEFADGTIWTQSDLNSAYLSGVATGGDDTIIGTDGNDVIDALAGNDTVNGGAGDDQIDGSAGNDVLNGGDGDDTLNGGDGNDTLSGGFGTDSYDGGAGTDTIDFSYSGGSWTVDLAAGTAATSTSSETFSNIENVRGAVGSDTLIGDSGVNTLEGGFGADRLTGGRGNDTLDGGSDSDTVVADQGSGDWTLDLAAQLATQGAEQDTLISIENAEGADGNDTLVGDDAANTLSGGAGNDTLTGGLGNDVIVGGTGDDTAVFAGVSTDYDLQKVNGVWTITDLQPTVNGDDGTDTVSQVEFAQFTDQTITLNRNPVGVNNTASTSEDTAVTITAASLLANDTDADNDTLSLTAVSNAVNGTVSLNGNGDVLFTPDADFNGNATFDYTVIDGNGGSDTATVTVSVSAVNDNPVAVDDTATTDQDTAVTITAASLLSNDTDIENDTLSLAAVSNPSNGTVSLDGNGDAVFTPTAGFVGQASFDYTVSDGNGGTDTGTVTVTVNNVNDAPVGVDDTASTSEDTAVTITAASLLANDTDADNDTLSLTAVSNAVNGAVSLDGNGDVLFTPDADFNGNATFDYTVIDGNGGTDTATVTVSISAVNDNPVAVDDTATTDEDTAVTITAASLLANDTDVENDTLSLTAVSNPLNGTVSLDGNGDAVFTPTAGFVGQASFDYTVSDGNGGTDTGSVTVTVNEVIKVINGTSGAETLIGTSGKDEINGLGGADRLEGRGDDDTLNGGDGNDVIYGEGGNDTINGGAGSDYIEGGAGDDVIIDGAGYDSVLGNAGADTFKFDSTSFYNAIEDYEVGIDKIDLSALGITYGDLTIAASGSDTDVDWAGGGVTVLNTTPGQMAVSEFVFTNNTAPVGINDTASTSEDTAVTITAASVLANDTDADNDTLSLTAVSNAVNGTVSLDGNGDVLFTPGADFNGNATFDYTVSDGNGGTDTATVTVSVSAVNDNPVAVDDTASTTQDTAVTVTAASLLANDTDVENDTLSLTAVSNPSNGTVSLDGNGDAVFTPAAGFTGQASFDYTVSDGNGGTDTGSVMVTVNVPANSTPVGVNDTASTSEDTAVTILASNLLSNDTDADNDTLSLAAVSNAVNGTASLDGNGDVLFTPGADFNGNATFDYTVSDGNGGTDTATVTVSVSAVNDNPVAVDDTATTDQDTAVTITAASLLSNDTDVENDTLSLTAVSNPSNGTVSLDGNGDAVFTPTAGFVGQASFDYTVSDGNGGTDTGSVTVTVNSTVNVINGTASDETLIGTAGVDEINGLGGADRLEGRGDDDTLNGGDGNDVLYGEGGNDTINGGAGSDYIEGGAGDDIIIDGAGYDSVLGNAGADTFKFDSSSWYNAIEDYEVGTDKIDLSALGITYGDLTIAASGSDTDVDWAGGGVTVLNTTPGQMVASEFIFT